MITDPYDVVHEVAGDDTLCGDYWFIVAKNSARRGWRLPFKEACVTCFRCVVRRVAWLD